MFCYKCGKEMPDGSKFCPKCGVQQKSATVEEAAAPEPVTVPEPVIEVSDDEKKSHNTTVIIAVIAAAAVVLGVIAGVLYFWLSRPSDTAEAIADTVTQQSADGSAGENETIENETEEGEVTEAVEEDEAPAAEDEEEEPEAAEDSQEEPVNNSPFAGIKAGDIVSFGSYEQDNNRSDGSEPIVWEVLDVEGDTALLISRYVLDCIPYNETNKKVTWETCTLRRWLNSDFYNEAFSGEDRSRIAVSHLKNENNQKSGTKGGNDTDDMVFCLSVSEVMKYYKFNNWYDKDQMGYCQDLLAGYTRYAQEADNGSLWIYTFDDGYMQEAGSWEHGGSLAYTPAVIGRSVAAWWLRSPGLRSNEACYVGGHGDAGASCDREVDNDDFGVRPAIRVSTR